MKDHESEGADEQRDNRWIAILSICLPGGTVRHPTILDRVEEELGSCITDTAYEGVRVGFYVNGDTYESAEVEARDIGQNVLSVIGLSTDTETDLKLGRADREPVAPIINLF